MKVLFVLVHAAAMLILMVRWKPLEREMALLLVPSDGEEQQFVARFHPETSFLHVLDSMRYGGADSEGKTLWINEALQRDAIGEDTIPRVGGVTRLDEGRPWAVFTVEEVVYHADVEDYIRAKGL